jgi:hypothetical protein
MGKPRGSPVASSTRAESAAPLPSTVHGSPSGMPPCAGSQRGQGLVSSSLDGMPSARASARWLSASGTTPQCSQRHTFSRRAAIGTPRAFAWSAITRARSW